jgi:hypothetical protein
MLDIWRSLVYKIKHEFKLLRFTATLIPELKRNQQIL